MTYKYTDTQYFTPQMFTNFDQFREHFGDPFDPVSGQILSPLSLAALLAFQNGATQVYGIGVVSTSDADFSSAIDKLVSEEVVNVVVPLTDDAQVTDYVKTHVNAMELNGIYRRGFLGLSAATGSQAQLIARAKALASPRIVLCGPSKVNIDTGASSAASRFQGIAGFYLAAAVAGLHSGLDAQTPLTRKQVFGFSDIPNQETKQNVVAMQAAGVLVVYQKRNGTMIVKHGLTTQTARESPVNGTIYTQEISVQAARDRLRDLLEDTLEDSDLIGSVLEEETPDLVMGTVTGALESAKEVGIIIDYADVQYRLPEDTPTVIQVRFQYKPALPLNYIHVQFALNTQSGELAFDDAPPEVEF